MRTVEEYRQLAEDCRKLAIKLANPDDRRALEMIATSWDRVADQREGALKKGLAVQPPPTDEATTE